MIPLGMSYRQAMQFGYAKPMRSQAYLDYVASLPCCGCGLPADEAHHMIGHGYKGMGTKAPDLFTLPLCRNCHDELHRSPATWEALHGDQWRHILDTLHRAWVEGVGS